jgi:hypothetical protein
MLSPVYSLSENLKTGRVICLSFEKTILNLYTMMTPHIMIFRTRDNQLSTEKWCLDLYCNITSDLTMLMIGLLINLYSEFCFNFKYVFNFILKLLIL